MDTQEWATPINDQQFVKDYKVSRPEGMSDAEWTEYVHTLEEQAASLQADGWTSDAIKEGYIATVNVSYDPRRELSIKSQLTEFFNDAHTFGSGIFQKMWTVDYDKLDSYDESDRPGKAQTLLHIAMKYTGMPEGDLDGSTEQTQELVSHMSKSLAPHDKFWDTFAETVQKAYPDNKGGNALGDTGGDETLKRQVHQFRYVISAQQAQWVRDNYKKAGMTDEEALATYLSTMEEGNGEGQYSLSESSRAHNKVKLDKNGNPSYPGNSNANYKVTIGFHSEFIIDQKGNFLNEVDPEGTTENGVVNGASFNYAEKNDDLHEKLDGNKAIRQYDPNYRKTNIKEYHAPNNLKSAFNEGWEDFKSFLTEGKGDGRSWDDSYWNNEGVYSVGGKSSYDRVEKEAGEFRDMIKDY